MLPIRFRKTGSINSRGNSISWDKMREKTLARQNHPAGKVVNGWTVVTQDIGSYGTNNDARAGVACVGLGANLPADALYPMTCVDADGHRSTEPTSMDCNSTRGRDATGKRLLVADDGQHKAGFCWESNPSLRHWRPREAQSRRFARL